MLRYSLYIHVKQEVKSTLYSRSHPLRQEDVSAVYNCCWVSPAQPYFGPSPVGYVTIFLLSQIWDSSNLEDHVPLNYFSQKQGDLVIPPGIGFHSSLLTTHTTYSERVCWLSVKSLRLWKHISQIKLLKIYFFRKMSISLLLHMDEKHGLTL
jgi:hypothetical protein